ncbi:MAG TPA: hypothetical protein VF952_19175 [Chloroflexia bacterium]
MMSQELSLTGSASFTFPDGTRALASYYSQVERGEWRGHARIVIPDKGGLDLLDLVDDGQTVDEPRIHVIYGLSPSEVFLFGGPKAYRINSNGTVMEEVELYRGRELEEYWDTAIESTEVGILVIYESGCLLLDNMLQVSWHIKKYLNDFFYRVSSDEIEFLRDHEERWRLALTDGHVIEPPNDKQPEST